MTTQSESIHFLAILLATLAPFVLPASPALADNPAQAAANGQSWRVHYVNGPIWEPKGRKQKLAPLSEGAKLNMKAVADGIAFESKHRTVLSIPASAVTEITFDHPTRRVSKAVVALLGEGVCGGGDYLCGAFVMGDLFVAAVTLPFKYTNHYVRISWLGDQGAQFIEFKVGKREYQSLLAQLQTVTGINSRDLTRDLKGTGQALRGSDPCSNPALAENELSIPLNKFGTMQTDLNTVGACGFRLSGFGSAQSASRTASLHRDSPDATPYQYVIVRAYRSSKIQKALNQAGAQGYRLRPHNLTLNTLPPILVMEKSSASAHENYEYLYFTSGRKSKLRGKAEAAIQQGYQVVVQDACPAGHILILERTAGSGS